MVASLPSFALGFFWLFILTLFDESGDHEYRAIEREACIAHRGADRFGLSFGADPGVIFDAKPFLLFSL